MIARSTGADLVTGEGLEAALAGVDAVIDASNVASAGKRVSSEFFETTARTLMRTAATAGVRHIVALSIVGIDRVPYGYYQGKLRQEQVLQDSPVPVSILRAAQFDPVWFGVILTINMELGLITPPVGLNLFVINGITPDVKLGTILKGAFPFMLCMVLAIVILCVFPELATWLPQKVMQ